MSEWMVWLKAYTSGHFFDIHLVELKIVCRIKYKNKIISVYSEIEKSVVWRIQRKGYVRVAPSCYLLDGERNSTKVNWILLFRICGQDLKPWQGACVYTLLYTSVHLKLAPSQSDRADQYILGKEEKSYLFNVRWTCLVHSIFSKSDTPVGLIPSFNLIILECPLLFSWNKNDGKWPIALAEQTCFD